MHLANLCLQLFFKQIALARIALISLLKLLDELPHLFFLQLQAAQLLLKNAVLLVIAADAAPVVTPRGGRSALVTRIVIAWARPHRRRVRALTEEVRALLFTASQSGRAFHRFVAASYARSSGSLHGWCLVSCWGDRAHFLLLWRLLLNLDKRLLNIWLQLFFDGIKCSLLLGQIWFLFANSYLQGAHRLHERLHVRANLLSLSPQTVMLWP